MRDWVAGAGGCDAANLNSTLMAWDAVVDGAVGTPAGGLYATVAAALSAGAKSVYVRTYAYAAGFTASAGVIVVGESVPYVSGATLTGGPTFGGTITVPSGADGVTLQNLGTTGTTGFGFSIANADDFHAVDCIAHDASTTGWNVSNLVRQRLVRCRAVANGTNGFYWADGGAVNMTDNMWLGCQSQDNGGPGFILGTNADAASNIKEITLVGCHSRGDCTAYGAGGFSVGIKMGTLIMLGCHATESGSSAAGFYFYSPASGFYRVTLGNCFARNNTGAGIQTPATYNGGFILTGCHSYGNTGSNYVNMSGFTGYSTCA